MQIYGTYLSKVIYMQASVVLSIHIISLQIVHLGHIYPQNIFLL